MTSVEKARATRERLQAAQAQLWEEKREAIAAVRRGLLRVMENADSTSAEILKAAELLTELSKPY